MSTDLILGLDVPAEIGMAEDDIITPALVIDLDAFERNVETMRAQCAAMGVRLRVHGKMHKSADIARYPLCLAAVAVVIPGLRENTEAGNRCGSR